MISASIGFPRKLEFKRGVPNAELPHQDLPYLYLELFGVRSAISHHYVGLERPVGLIKLPHVQGVSALPSGITSCVITT